MLTNFQIFLLTKKIKESQAFGFFKNGENFKILFFRFKFHAVKTLLHTAYSILSNYNLLATGSNYLPFIFFDNCFQCKLIDEQLIKL